MPCSPPRRILLAVTFLSVLMSSADRLWPLDTQGTMQEGLQLLAKGAAGMAKGDLTSAEADLNKAATILGQADTDGFYFAGCCSQLAALANLKRDFEGATSWYLRAIRTHERKRPGTFALAVCYNNLGSIYQSEGQIADAEEWLRRAKDVFSKVAPTSAEYAVCCSNLGGLLTDRGDIQGAQVLLTTSLHILEAKGKETRDFSNVLQNMGVLAASQGDLKRAEELLQRALGIEDRRAPGGEATAQICSSLGAVACSRGDFAVANLWHKRALDIKESIKSSPASISTSLSNLGVVAQASGEYKEAETWFRRALRSLGADPKDELMLAVCFNNLGTVCRRLGRPLEARDWFSKALEIKERQSSGITLAATYGGLGLACQDVGDLDAAEKWFKKAAELADIKAPGSLEQAVALINLATLCLDRGNASEAIELYAHATELVENHRADIRSPEGRRLFSDIKTQPYRSLARAHAMQGNTAEAFAVVERMKGRATADALSARGLSPLDNASSDERNEYFRLASEARTARVALGRLADDHNAEAAQLRAKIAQTEAQIRMLDDRIRAEASEARLFARPVTLVEAQNSLDEGTALLNFLVCDDEVFCFAVTTRKARMYRSPIRSGELSSLVQEFLHSLTTRLAVERGRRLFELLVRPSWQEVMAARRLLVCPDGVLHAVPFAALIEEVKVAAPVGSPVSDPLSVRDMTSALRTRGVRPVTEGSIGASDVVFFGDRIPIHYAVSATVYRSAIVRSGRPNGKPRLALFGAPSAPGFGDLSGVDEELRSLSQIPGFAVHVEPRAERAGLQDKCKDADYLHFACHGVIDHKDPLNSRLILQDGPLFASELLQNWSLGADMVVLSACDTALGQITSDGVIGLTRSLLCAGARSVVSALWSIPDESTACLMKAFYTGLAEGRPKDLALANAVRVVRATTVWNGKSVNWTSPLHWAAFQLNGAWR